MHIIDKTELDHGITVKVVLDDSGDTDMPYSDDEGVKIVVLHRDYIDPSKGECGRTADEVRQWVKENAREWFVANLYLYDHSGTVYRAGMSNPFSCPWDSGQVGIVALKKSEWGKGKGERNAKRLEYAKGVAEYYSAWANGEVYGYIVEDEEGEQLDSCWGFIGESDYCMTEGVDSGKYHVDQIAATLDGMNNLGDGI